MFSENVGTPAALTVLGADGNEVDGGQVEVVDTTLRRTYDPAAFAPGVYTVSYQVTSADGHVVSGSWPFQLTVAGTGEPGPAVTDRSDAAPAIPRRYADPQDDLPIWPFVAGAVVLVGAGLWFNRPRS